MEKYNKNNHQHERLESSILNTLNHTLKYESYDELIRKASFTYVELTPDGSLANVYVDTFNRDDINKLVDKLNASKGLFKRELSKYLNLRRIPDLKFARDTSIDRVIKIEELLKGK
jgi:ribosome-binding factor A